LTRTIEGAFSGWKVNGTRVRKAFIKINDALSQRADGVTKRIKSKKGAEELS